MSFLNRLFGRPRPPQRDLAALLASMKQPAVHITLGDTLSRSHFGGSPRLPADVRWPEWNGQPLAFLARLSLAEVHARCRIDWLPKDGALLFFYEIQEQPLGFDPQHRGSALVLLVPDLELPLSQLSERQAPCPGPVVHRNMALRRIEVLPSSESAQVEALTLSEAEAEAFIEMEEAPYEDRPKHQVGGHPAAIEEAPMDVQCQLVSHGIAYSELSGDERPRSPELEPGAVNWRLLLQLDTDDELGWEWGDGGLIYFWVEEQAARRGDFTNTWLILQTY